MKVAELMRANVKTVREDAMVEDVLRDLADAHVSGLPVVDRHGRMIGVVSQTDIIAAEAEAGDGMARTELMEDTMVRDIMTPRVLTIGPEAEVREAAEHMLYADVHRLFVAKDAQPIGVISAIDIVSAVAAGKF